MKKIYLFPVFIFVVLLNSCSQESTIKDTERMNKQDLVYETIMNRRSIRAYKPEQVPQEKLDSIMQCAIYAPSALNRQSWEVRVVQNPELLSAMNNRFVDDAKGKSLKGSAARAQEPGFSVFHGAPTLIIVAHDKSNSYSLVDCGLLAENVLLSAESMDLGTCVIGNMAGLLNNPKNKDLRDKLALPDTHDIAFGIALGYKNENPQAPERKTDRVKFIR